MNQKIKESNNQKIQCHFPWTTIYVAPNGNVKHCCSTNLSKLGNLSTQSFEEIWNGTIFQNIRKKIHTGDFGGAFCNPICPGLREGKGYPWYNDRIKDNCSEKIADNEKLAKYNFENGINIVNHKPLHLGLEFSNCCNLRCIMCFYEFKPPFQFIPDIALDRLLEISDYACGMSLMGGEVFFNKQDLKFIDTYSPPEGAYISFITNGTLLNEQMLEKLKKFKLMGMQISVDATSPDIYEKIRKRSDWKIVDTNIKQLVKTAKELAPLGYNWSICLSFVVLKSNISNIAHTIEYATTLNADIVFQPVRGYHLYDENIFVYKNILKQAGDWKLYLKESFDILEKNKETYTHYSNVLQQVKYLEQYLLNEPKISVKKWIVALLCIFIPGKKKQKHQTGLTEKDRKVGHFLEVYYNWRVGNVSFKTTFNYLFHKTFRKNKR